jgi:peptide-methionine (S)-S-oxide reductase
MSTATFAAGCFWGVEAAFRKVEGVTATEVGYIGGSTENPSYQDVCTGRTGHAEAARVTFDPAVVTFDELLEVFWTCHDPTQLDRQGPDVGTQYRSAVFTHDEAQAAAARASRDRLIAGGRAVVTEIAAAGPFWRAEEYHQQYLAKRGQDACASTLR